MLDKQPLRFTISVSPDMAKKLDALKQRIYYRTSRNVMIQDILLRGLASFEAEEEASKDKTAAAPNASTGKSDM